MPNACEIEPFRRCKVFLSIGPAVLILPDGEGLDRCFAAAPDAVRPDKNYTHC